MSSLLKMNNKFLSKSSWSIRSGNNSSNNSNNNNNRGQRGGGGGFGGLVPYSNAANNKVAITQLGSGGGGKPFSVTFGGNNNKTLDTTTTTSKRRPDGNARTITNNNNNGKSYKTANTTQTEIYMPHNNATSTSINNNTRNTTVTPSTQFHRSPFVTKPGVGGVGGGHLHILKRTKGMSQSITDLRELKEKPKKSFTGTTNGGVNNHNNNNKNNDENDEVQQEIKERRIDMYIAEIEMDPLFQLGSTIRAIYDGDDYDRFMAKLDTRIKNHDKDIERMCNCHYQGFVDCIHELLKVRPQAENLRTDVYQTDQELQRSSENILRKADELIKYRRVVCNTKIAIEHLQECLPVLETFYKLIQQMAEKKYYPALKTLEQFESLYIPKIEKYRFAQSMCQRVPKIRETIKKESMKDLKDFLENIRQLTTKIGEIAMRNIALQHKSKEFANILAGVTANGGGGNMIVHDNDVKTNVITPTTTSGTGDLVATGANDDDGNNHNNNLLDNLDNEDYLFVNEELSATDIVDFSPVYRCLHIFGCLGAREQFENYYRVQRKKQAILILQSISSSGANLFTGDTFRNYLFGVVGFFVIEDHLLNTSSGLVTRSYLAENWEEVTKSLMKTVHVQATLCEDAKQMLYMKGLLMLFCHTTQSYGYSVEPLMKLLVELRQLYTDLLLRQWTLVFQRIFDLDNYHPLQVNNQAEFELYFNDFPFTEMDTANRNEHNNHQKDDTLNGDKIDSSLMNNNTVTTTINTSQQQQQQQYPKKFPFSSFVPNVYKAVRQFIATSLEFTQDLNLSVSDIEDTVRKSTNMLLTRTLSDCLASLIKKPNLGLLQLIQISINTNYLEESSTYLELYISELIHHNANSSVNELMMNSGIDTTDTTSSATTTTTTPTTAATADHHHQTLKYQQQSSTSSSNGVSSGSGTGDHGMSQSHLARLQGRTTFKDARSEAELQIYSQLNKKIDEFFDLANYDYLLSDSPGKASSYILDLMAFLNSTFEAFTNLPVKVAQTASLSACKYIAGRLLAILTEDEVKAISHGFLQQFNLDLMQCEMFTLKPVKDLEHGALQTCFAELRQLMDLFIEFDSWSTYFAEYGKNDSRYLRVNPQTALILLEKLVRGDSKKTIFSALSKNERDKKNRIDTILKKLKQLTLSNGGN